MSLLEEKLFSPHLFCGLARCDILNGKENHLRILLKIDSAGIEKHRLASDARKVMVDLEVMELCVLRDDIFEKRSQFGNVPLAVAQLVYQFILYLFSRDPECVIKGTV